MRVWIIWPQAPQAPLLTLIQSVGGLVVQVDDMLDRAEEHYTAVEADVVLINSLTPGSQDLADWIIQRRFERRDLRWVVAFPPQNEYQPVTRWLRKLLQANVYDWVFEGSSFVQNLQQRLTTPAEWADAVTVLGGPQAVGPWEGAVLVPGHPANPTQPQGDPPPVSDEPVRREVVVVSPSKPILIAVAGISTGVGTSCAAVGIAERLEVLGQRTILVELDQAKTSTYADWQPALAADVAGPDDRWDLLPLKRTWSYIVIDCHTLWGSVPAAADLIVMVGPGHAHRWARWTDWEKGILDHRKKLDVGKSAYLVAPGPAAADIANRLRQREVFHNVPVLTAGDVFQEADGEAWDRLLTPVLPPVSNPKTRHRGWRGLLSTRRAR